MSSFLVRLAPPMVVDLGQFLFRYISGFSGHFENYDEALERTRGYEVSSIVEHYERELREACRRNELSTSVTNRKLRVLAAIGLALRKLPSRSVRLLDVGGGWGGDYFQLAQHLPEVLQWVVVESPTVVSRLQMVEQVPEQLRFESELTTLMPCGEKSEDLIYASGFIQYVPRGLRTVSDFARMSRFLILDRVPLVECKTSFVAIQRTSRFFGGVGSSYPAWFFAEQEFHKTIETMWEVVLSWQVSEDRPLVQGTRRPYQGFLLERREAVTSNHA